MAETSEHAATAIIGMACRLPGADDLDDYWRNLAAGVDAVVEIPAARWSNAEHYDPARGMRGRTRSRWCGLVEGVELFDERLFRISAREARSMDPQQRLLLEQGWRCVEDAGVSLEQLQRARTGVFVAVMANDYQQRMIEAGQAPDAFAALGNYEAIVANRLSHCLGLCGPSLTVNAACAGSLVALHLARRALAAGDCDYALVGAANLNLHPWKYVSFSQAGMLSPAGRCRTFDIDAQGYVPGDGVAAVLLCAKPEAQAQGHRIHALVRGSAINHVGGGRSITAPSVASQRELIEAAATDAQLDLASLSYVEAHGTGTSLGDPIEVAALDQALQRAGAAPGACALGSVKANLGHLEACAGLAGLIKVALMLRHEALPPSVNLDTPNPLLDLEGSHLRLVPALESWPRSEGAEPRRAGLSSFGFGGANAHAIIEEHREVRVPALEADEVQLLTISGHTPAALAANLAAWREHLAAFEGRPEQLRDLCAVAARRAALEHRVAVCGRTSAQLLEALDEAPALEADPRPWALCFGDLERGRALAFAERLTRLGFVPALVLGEAKGQEAVLAFAGVTEAEDGTLTRPRLPTLDPLSGEIVAPLRATPAYLSWLRGLADGWPDPTAAQRALVELGAALWQRQFSFTKFLREWARPLAAIGVELEAGLRAVEPTLALVVAVAASVQQVDERWSLGLGRKLGEELGELVDLAVDAVLNREQICELLGHNPTPTEALAAALHAGLPRADLGRPYPRLRACSQTLEEHGDAQAYQAALTGLPRPTLPVEHRIVRLGPGASACELSLERFNAGAWRALAGELWRRGVDIDRAALYPAGSFRVVDAPLYRFDRRRAWIDEAPAQTILDWRSARGLAREHVIRERPLVPGAFLIAALLREHPALRSLALLRPLALDGEGAEPQLELSREGSKLSLDCEGERLLQADVGEGAAPAGLDIEAPRFEPVDYAALAARGYGYGERLRVLEGASEGAKGWMFTLAPGARGQLAAWIEAAFQAVIIAGLVDEGGALAIPYSVEQIRRGEAGEALHVVVEREGLRRESWGLRARVQIYAADGSPRLVVEGAALRLVEGSRSREPKLPAELLWRPTWVSTEQSEPMSHPAGHAWVIASERSELAARLLAVAPASSRVAIASLDDFRRARSLLDGLPDPTRIYFVAEAEEPTMSLALVHLCRALAWRRGLEVALVLVTRALHCVEDDDRPGPPELAELTGILKSSARELDELRALAVDLDADVPAAQLSRLLTESGPAPLAELAYRDARRYVRALEPLAVSGPAPLREGGVYVIVGGFGGLGREIARSWTRRFGARVALIGRRPPDAELSSKLAELSCGRGEVGYWQADGCSPEQLSAALADIRARFGSIDGAIHSALVLADRSIRHMDAAHFEAARAVKAEGARLLARLCSGDELDFLALFSSVLALQGNAGQANYVAGCAYQDALAASLRDAGQPAISIAWGHWGEVGAVTDAHHTRLLAAQGIEAMTTAEGLAGLDVGLGALASGVERVVVARLSPARRASMMTTQAPPPAALDYEAEFELLERYAQARVFDCLASAWPRPFAPGEALSLAKLREALALLPKYARLLAAWLDALVAGGLLERLDAERWRVLSPAPDGAKLRAQLLSRSADKRAHVELLDASMDEARAMLCGQRPAPAVLFPGSSPRLVAGVYRENALSDVHNRLLAAAVIERVEASDAARVSILELGAGTGSSTAALLPSLDDLGARLRYVYSDVSRAFTKHGRRTFGPGRPYLEFELVDIEAIDDELVERLGEFDLILATNVVHACADLRRTLTSVRRLLRLGGRLLLNELCRVELFWTSTFGFLDGWWLYSDGELRLDHGPLVGPEVWPRLLEDCGFEAGHSRSASALGRASWRQCLVSAARPASSSRPVSAPPAPRTPPPTMNSATLRSRLTELVAAVLEVEIDDLDVRDTFSALGVDSILGVELITKINAELGTELEPTVVYDYRSIAALSDRLASEVEAAAPAEVSAPARPASDPVAPRPAVREPLRPAPPPARPTSVAASEPRAGAAEHEDIAIIGVSGRYPGADNLDALWTNLAAGVDSVTKVPRARWDADAIHDGQARRPNTSSCRYGGFLDAIDRFDPFFFKISPREAERMDPQQRLFLEEAWRCLEDGGYIGARRPTDRAGVFVGARHGDYLLELYRLGLDIDGPTFTGTDVSMLAARIAYHLGLHGPTLAIDTACSSSLVAIHEACQHLRAGEVDLALAGGVFVMSTPQFHLMASKTGMLAPRGRCRSFDEGAEGFVPGEGVGVVLLKRAREAIADGDHIHALIKASGINQDGRSNGITAPSAQSQARLIEEVLARAQIDPASVSYVEAHGTGTKLGDPIEIEGLRQGFAARASGPLRPGSCALGSIKTNVGHTATAAGVAGVLKVVLAMRHRQLPASLHFERENRHLKLERTPFRVVDRLEPWASEDSGPLRAGVSSFGFSGTNCHLILEQPPDAPARAWQAPRPELFLLAAKTEAALRERCEELASWLRARVDQGVTLELGDLAHSLAVRSHEGLRRAFVASEARELLAGLAEVDLSPTTPSIEQSPLLRRFVASLASELDDLAVGENAGRAERLAALGDAWERGLPIDALALYPIARHRLIPLPVYPFARERHWPEAPTRPSFNPLLGASVRPQLAAQSARRRLLVRRWGPAPALERGPAPTGEALILFARGSEALARELQRLLPGARLLGPELVRPRGPVDLLVDLSDLSASGRIPAARRLAFLQQLLGEDRHRSAQVLHVGDRLRTPAASEARAALDLDALSVAEIVARLGAELRTIRGRSLDLDLSEGRGERELAKLVLDELADRGATTQVAVRAGQRFAPALVPCESTRADPLPVRADATYLVTGGVRGLGLETARWLVGQGARKLILAGRRPLPPRSSWAHSTEEQLAALQALVDEGVELRILAGDLAELASVTSQLRAAEAELGPVAGVIHCAGAAELRRPAFLTKTAADLERVYGPKLGGLRLIDALLTERGLDFVLAFSSISTEAPRLAAGLLDYAAANAVVNAWAERRAAAGLRCHALVWGNWTGAGMGAVAGRSYVELGLELHDIGEGLALLERAASSSTDAVVAPLAVDPSRFELAALGRPAAAPELREPRPEAPTSAPALAEAPDVETWVLAKLRETLARALKLPLDRIEADTPFADLGVDSILLVEYVVAIEAWLGQPLDPSLALDHSTLRALSAQLQASFGERLRALASPAQPELPDPAPAPSAAPARVEVLDLQLPAARRPDYAPVAIIGMACNFPASPSLDAYWQSLREGRDCTREIPSSRWSIAEHYAPAHAPGKSISKRGGFIEGIERFDPRYFELPEDDAAEVDPLVRQFLEVGVRCVHDAGLRREELAGREVGVFVGSRVSNYAERLRTPGRRSLLGLGQNFIAAHLTHYYDLRGPALVVDTACSSSLTSLHQAVASLHAGECELAVAGGVDILLDEVVYQRLSEARVLSPEGCCFVFDERANGFVPGEGAGALLLAPLDAAIARGDRIHALVEATAINNDGRTMGVTTPNPRAQVEVVREALRRANLDARQIGYVEAHGTGTALGDPLELRALTELFEAEGVGPGLCPVGSVKSNLGHLLSAAGVASVIKVALALEHRELPPTLHCEHPNPRFEFARSPFWPCTELRPWTGPLRAGISSFGFGGTNVHAILGAAPAGHRGRPPLAEPSFDRRRHWLERGPSSPSPRSARPLGRLDFGA